METFISQCAMCQQAKHLQSRPAGLLQPLPILEGVWKDLSMHFLKGLPKNDGYIVILVVVDRLTKYAHFFPLKHTYSAVSVSRILYDGVVKLYGLPKSIVFDRDKIFTNTVWTEIFKLMGVKLLYSTTNHPQTDGQTKCVNHCLEMYLHCAIGDSPKQWRASLGQAECGIILISILPWAAPLSKLVWI